MGLSRVVQVNVASPFRSMGPRRPCRSRRPRALPRSGGGYAASSRTPRTPSRRRAPASARSPLARPSGRGSREGQMCRRVAAAAVLWDTISAPCSSKGLKLCMTIVLFRGCGRQLVFEPPREMRPTKPLPPGSELRREVQPIMVTRSFLPMALLDHCSLRRLGPPPLPAHSLRLGLRGSAHRHRQSQLRSLPVMQPASLQHFASLRKTRS